MSPTPELLQERARETFELFELGLEMQRAQLRRTHPDADEEEIEELLRRWLRHRPGSEHGDAGPQGFRPRPITP
jgi:hypothetical protein